MFTLAALSVAMFVGISGHWAQAAVTEIPVRGSEKILISVPEAVVNVQATNARTLKINLVDGANEDYVVQNQSGLIRIAPKEPLQKENFARVTPKRRLIEIQGPSVPLEVHSFEGQIQLNKWAKESLLQLQKGRIISREGQGTLVAHSQSGEIQVLDHQGRVEVDSYKSGVVVRNLTGDADIENFAGETTVDKARGFLSLNQGQGTTKVTGSGGTLQFEVTKGSMNVQGFQGRVEGQSLEGPVTVAMASETDVNLRSQNGRITVQTSPNSGTFLNLANSEGDIQVPSYLRVNRDGGQKTLKGRLKGESSKGSIVVRSQEGLILIR